MDEKYIRLDRRISKNLLADTEEMLLYLKEKYKIPFKLEDDLSEAKWIKFSDLKNLDFSPAVREVLKHIKII